MFHVKHYADAQRLRYLLIGLLIGSLLALVNL